jgi:hypothetical protein
MKCVYVTTRSEVFDYTTWSWNSSCAEIRYFTRGLKVSTEYRCASERGQIDSALLILMGMMSGANLDGTLANAVDTF